MGFTEEDYETAVKAFWAAPRLAPDAVRVRAALDAVAHRLQPEAAGFEVTEELVLMAVRAAPGLQSYKDWRAGLQAVSDTLAKQAAAPRFPAVTDEQAEAINRARYEIANGLRPPIANERPRMAWEDIRDAINEVMGGETGDELAKLSARIAELEGELVELEAALRLSREATQAAVDAWNEETELRKRVQPSEPAGEWTAEDEIAAASGIAYEIDDRDKLEDDDFRIARAALKAVRYRLQPSEPAGDLWQAFNEHDDADFLDLVAKTACTQPYNGVIGRLLSMVRSRGLQPAGDLPVCARIDELEATTDRLCRIFDRLAQQPAAPVSPLDTVIAEMKRNKRCTPGKTLHRWVTALETIAAAPAQPSPLDALASRWEALDRHATIPASHCAAFLRAAIAAERSAK